MMTIDPNNEARHAAEQAALVQTIALLSLVWLALAIFK